MFTRPATVENPHQQVALDCVAAGITAADPATAVADALVLDGTDLVVDGDRYDLGSHGEVVVLGGGNAAGVLAAAIEDALGEYVTGGAVATDNTAVTDRVEVLPGDHPVPSERGVESTREVLRLAERAGEDSLVLAVIAGGGSALMPAPADGIGLSDLQAVTQALLACGADIGEINVVRKHCSAVKGGLLARTAAPATVVGLVVSDVVGNRLDVVASGPLAPDESTYEDALDVIDRYDLTVPDAVAMRLRRGAEGDRPETPAVGDEAFEAVHQYVIADGTTALRGAAAEAETAGYEPLILSSRVRGEAREVAKALAGIAEECAATGTPVEPPAVLLSGGETTVTVTGDGAGGPNQELALSAALALDAPAVTVASVDTDGIDGATETAGGIATAADVEPVAAEARAALLNNDAGGFLDRHDGQVVSGPTDTNVNDLTTFVVPGTE